MANPRFSRRLEVDVDVEDLWAWHARPGAFERLVPPWEPVELATPPAPIEEGATQTIELALGPLRLPWVSEIGEVVVGRSFQDVQVKGPFAHWVHTHAMEPLGPGRSALEDRVEYRLPVRPFGGLVAGRHVRRKLERMFAYRHRVTAGDLRRHAAAGDARLDVLITGASGLVGRALAAFLTTGGHRVRRLVRREPRRADEHRWDPETGELDPHAFDGVDAVVHLAGENIAGGRWTGRQKGRIRSSRVRGTRLLVEALCAAPARPRVLVSASAVGLYGDRGDELLDESSEPGRGFLADVGREWEGALEGLDGVRVVRLRFGMILSPAGGALAKLLPPFRAGAGGRLGSGRQWVSWIALDDALHAVHRALVDDALVGPVNAVAPRPVTNADLAKTLAGVLGRPALLPVPPAALRLAVGAMADELLLASQRAVPRRLQEAGFEFGYPDLASALRHVLGR